MDELKGLDLHGFVRAAPPDQTGVTVAVGGDNVP